MYFGMFVHLVCNTSNQKKKKKTSKHKQNQRVFKYEEGFKFWKGLFKNNTNAFIKTMRYI